MKKISFLASLLCLVGSFAYAQKSITVDNGPLSGAQYTSIQDAADAANPGDTLYVAGSLTSYGNLIIEKELHIIGAGYNTNEEFFLNTELSYVYLQESSNQLSDASNSTVQGTLMYNLIFNNEVENVRVFRNYIKSNISFSPYSSGSNVKDISIYHNRVGSDIIGRSTASNISIRNNILTAISSFKKNSIIISNNIFIGSNGNCLFNLEYSLISNNIFYGKEVNASGNEFCSFSNNISYSAEDFEFSGGNNTFGGNIQNQDPAFVDAEDFTFDFSEDFHLTADSPGKNAGTDGTDIGIYGGTSPYPSSDVEGYKATVFPAIPQVSSFRILNSTVPQGGNLEIEFNANKVN